MSHPVSTPTKTEVASLRAELVELHEKGLTGDIPRRQLDRTVEEKTVALYRAAIKARLDGDERVVAEHHAVLGHMRLTESVMREPDQEAISLFATDRRLIRVRSLPSNEKPASLSEQDGTVIDELPLAAIDGLVVRRQVRWGEAATGLVITAFALLFRSWLLVTGTLLMALGGLGVLHALLLPTRWIEIQASPRLALEPWRILAVRKKSARTLRDTLTGVLRARAPAAPR